MTEYEKIKEAEVETYKRMYEASKEEIRMLRDLIAKRTKTVKTEEIQHKHSCL